MKRLCANPRKHTLMAQPGIIAFASKVELNKKMLRKETFRNFLLAAFFAGLTAVGGIMAIPVPPVPFTMQSFFVLTSGLFLGPKYGPLSQILYITMGLAGVPVFAGGTGGLHYVFSPTFGFLVGFVAVSWVAGLLVSMTKTTKDKPAMLYSKYVLVCLTATVTLYAVGLPLFYLNMRYVLKTPLSIVRTFELALLPFVIPDLIKAILAAGLASKTISALRDTGLLPSS